MRFVKRFIILGCVVISAALALNFSLIDFIEKTQRIESVKQLESLKNYLEKKQSSFEETASQWAAKPEVLALYELHNQKSRKRLSVPNIYKTDAVGFIALLDKNNKPLFMTQFDESKQQFSNLNEKIKYQLTKSGFLNVVETGSSRSGIIYAEKLYIIAIAPVMNNVANDDSEGLLIIGQALSETDIEHDNLVDIEIDIVNVAMNSAQALLLSAFEKKKFVHSRAADKNKSGFLLKDITGHDVAIISRSRPLTKLQELLSISWLSLIVLFSVAVLIGYLFWWSHKRKLSVNIKNLESDIRAVRIGAELSSRLSGDNRDVLKGIVSELNQKIGSFEKTFVDNRRHDADIVLNELPLEAYLKDIDLKYVTVNQKYCDNLGISRETILGKTDSELIDTDAAESINVKEKAVILAKKPYQFEQVFVAEGKADLIYSIQLIPFMNAKGQVEGVVGVRVDITDHKLAEEEMALAAKVLDNTAEGVMVTDSGRRIVHVNAAYTEMTGYDESELLGKIPLLLQAKSKSKTYQDIQHQLEQNGTWKGELWSSRKNGSSYPEMANIKAIRNKQGEITNYFSMSNDITEQKKWQDQLYDMAHYDVLTGLPNRILFKDRLKQEIIRCSRNKKNIGILFLDIDLFKSINDSLGHAAGDELLKVVSKRLGLTLRTADSIARLGGDEFTVMVTDLALDYKKNIGYLKSLCEKIIDVVKQPMQIEGREINVTCSIGVAVFPIDAENVEDLLRNADSAMYYAKSQGRRNYQFYSKEFNDKAVERLEKEIEFRAALKNGSLQLYYQPQVDVISRQVVGAEALLRWRKGEDEVLGPEKIVLLAEETGLIFELGSWIMKTACLECKKWMDHGHKHLRVAVNLSTRQFRQKDLVQIVCKILEETGLPGRLLELEVTESALMENIEYSIEMMAELSRKGVRWSLDDFGTGYSSLNYLRDFPVHVLKVDQSFVREITINPEDAAIVETIIDLAHRLHLTVIAEGVESEEQLKVLSRMNCEQVQGYYFSKPITAENFFKFIDSKL